jgi:hypothetical protein
MNYEDCMLAILTNPEDDEPRRELAKFVRPSDPDLAEFIEFQLDHSQKKRARHGLIATPSRDEQLLDRHMTEWTRDLEFYLGEIPFVPTIEFHRGLPWLCSMNPYTFLEHGEYIFNRVAPLRGVEFFADPEGDPFPAKEIAASPLLARLDEIRFHEDTLRAGDLVVLTSSPHLERVMAWDVRQNPLSLEDFEAFAANPRTRKCLMISNRYRVPSDEGPIGECYARFDVYPYRNFDVSNEGKDLERKYGYLPWLHKANICDPKDAHYWVEHHELPKYVPGSPADAAIPYGSGLHEEDTFEPREKFDALSFDSYW